MLIYIFNLEVQETSVFKTSKQPKKSDAAGGWLLRLSFCLLYGCFLRSASYQLEHTYFEAQACVNIPIFNDMFNYLYTYHPTLGKGLHVCERPRIMLFHSEQISIIISLVIEKDDDKKR